VGEIVDYMPIEDRKVLEVDVCVRILGSKIDPAVLTGRELIKKGIDIMLGNFLEVEFDPDADSQFYMQISTIGPLNFNMENKAWR
jgi:hypothetical protein